MLSLPFYEQHFEEKKKIGCFDGKDVCSSIVSKAVGHMRIALPVNEGAHVQADVLKTTQHALLHRAQINQLVIHMYELHAALKGTL